MHIPVRTRKIVVGVFLFLLIAFIAIPPIIVYSGKFNIYRDVGDVTPTKIGIVFGAGVQPDGSPSPMLRDRLITAQELYDARKIETLIVSGDNSVSHYNEPQAMYNYLLGLGVPEDAIVRDYAGRRTYDTCYRAHEIFGVDRALLITQGYHLPRALFLCDEFDITVSGLSATRQEYAGETHYKIREVLALYKGVLDVYMLHPTPILGDPIEIEDKT